MEWTGGTWNTFSLKLEDDEVFNPKKIKFNRKIWFNY